MEIESAGISEVETKDVAEAEEEAGDAEVEEGQGLEVEGGQGLEVAEVEGGQGQEVQEELPKESLHGILKHVPPKEGVSQEVEVEEVPSSKKRSGKGSSDKSKKKLVPVWALFRFADFWDVLMIVCGFIMAATSGVGFPVHTILFGRVVNQFVYHGVATDERAGVSLSTLANRLATSLNTSCTTDLIQQNRDMLFPSMNSSNSTNTSMLLCPDQGSTLMENVVEYVCDPQAALMSNVSTFSLYYVALASSLLVLLFLATIFWNVSAYRQTRRIRQKFYSSILYQEIGWFDVNEASELSTRLADDVEKIQAGIGDKLSIFLNYISTFLACFLIAFSFNWKLALVVGAMVPVLAGMSAAIAKIVATFAVREQSAYAAAGAVAEEVLSSIRTVVAFGGESREAERYDVQLFRAKKEGSKKGFFSSLVVGLFYFVIFSSFALGFWYGSVLIVNCEVVAGDVITVFFAVILGSFSLGNAVPELETFGTALGSASVVFQVIDRKPEVDASSDEGEVLDSLEGNIKFRDVVFHYPARPSVQVLKGFDLDIKRGQTVALVGPSGCGKSTVIQLLQRFYNPNAGQITIDGHAIAGLNLKWLRANIGVVSQEPVLFNTTIAENIGYGREEATMEEIKQAARNANAYDFISKLPEGFDTDVGERGAQLSGGQKQRIAIARALIRDPKVLLLDEATSALDTESEKVVQEALDKAREGRTTIVIAHRLSTIQNADTIISVEDGRVAESGSHAELMDNEGLYYQLVTAQTISEEEENTATTEGLEGFKVAVKRSLSTKQRGDSVSSGGKPSLGKQTSVSSGGKPLGRTMSQRSYNRENSHFSTEDIPIVSSPSPFPGRVTFLGPEEVQAPSDDEEEDQEFEVTGLAEEEEEEGQEEGGDVIVAKQSPATITRLIRRRRRKEDSQLRKVSFKELLLLNKPDWPLVLIGVILSAIAGCLFPLMAVLFGEILRIFGLSDREELERGANAVAGGFVGLAVFSGVIFFLASFSLSIAGERLTKRIRLKTFQAILKQEIGWFDQRSHSTGALATRLATDAAELKGATGIRLGTVLQVVFGLVAAVLIAFTASWELSFVMISAFPIIGVVGFFQIRLSVGRAKKNKKRLERSGQTAVESIDNIRTVAGLGVEHRFLNRYEDLLSGPFKDSVKSVFLQAFILSLSQSLVFYLYATGFTFGGFLVANGRNTYENVFQVFIAVVFTALSLGRASSFAPDATKAKISATRILSLLDRKPLIDVTNTDGQKMEVTYGDIAVKSVHFNYPARPDISVLQGIDVSVKPGQTLALVGPSGCGKSTIVSLVERFYDPVLGSLTLEGTDLRDLNLKWLRTQIGIVSQEPILFDASIAENIRYGALYRSISDDEVIKAAKSANIHSFIESLPEGYTTNVGSKGTQLSGGQKQRIAIARALIRDPKVLLLDEATSALDTESEKVVQEALDKAREGRTTIVIAHRLSTIYNSDVIAVIHNGQVLESGTHSDLMAMHGAYYHLNTVQLPDYDEL